MGVAAVGHVRICEDVDGLVMNEGALARVGVLRLLVVLQPGQGFSGEITNLTFQRCFPSRMFLLNVRFQFELGRTLKLFCYELENYFV